MFKNFASQPANYLGYRVGPVGSNGISLTANDLRGEVTKSGDFFDFSNFLECAKCKTKNCKCNDISDFKKNTSMNSSKLNANGYESEEKFDWLATGKDVLTGGIKYITTKQQIDATREAQRLQDEQNRGRQIELAKEKEQTSQIKAYVLPIAIGGAVVIVGIAAYFIFKKKTKV